MNIEINELISNIVKEEIKWHINTTEQYLKNYEEGKWVAFYTHDKEKDIKLLKKDLKAFKRVLSYYLLPHEEGYIRHENR